MAHFHEQACLDAFSAGSQHSQAAAQVAGRREKKVIHDRLKQFVYDESLTAN